MKSLYKNIRIARRTILNEKYKAARNFDSGIFTELFNTSDEITVKIADIQKRIKTAKENGDGIQEYKNELVLLRKAQKDNDLKIKQARQKSILYNRANKPLLDAKKCVARYESYRDYLNMV